MNIKKMTAALLSLAMLAGLGTVAATADEEYRQHGEFWMMDAPQTSEILSQSAGFGDITWKVPYLEEKPVIDGKIGETEYKRFSNFEDYLTYMAPLSGTTSEEFETFLMNVDHFSGNDSFVTPWWGWDGEYLYMAFVVQNLSGFYCNPPSSLYLFTQNCLQIGIGDEFASGNQYTELGFGVNSETGDLITHTWLGSFNTEKGTDYTGHYDEDTGIVTYEFRISLAETVGKSYPEGESVAAGDYIKLAWLLSVNGNGNRVSPNGEVVTGEEWQVGFCHGIGGPYSYKASEFFACVSLGAPGENTEETTPETAEETTPETSPESETTSETVPETLHESDNETIADSETAVETESQTAAITEPNGTAAETAPADDDGCGSVLSVGIGALTAGILASSLLLRKKED